MTPKPAPEMGESPASDPSIQSQEPLSGDEVVITGVAGKYPNSDNTEAFMKNLYDQVDMISDDDRRWKLDHPEIPQRTGKINGIIKFDAQFFGVHYKQAWTMDPMCRQLLELVYSAIVDAGMNPRSLRNSKTGVFVGSNFSESEKTWFYEKAQVNGFGIVGCSRAMLANRLSYWLGTTGPSYTVDTACNSSLSALEHAYKAIRSGYCEAAVVGGAHLCMHPYISLLNNRLGFLSKDGKTKTFDEKTDGYARSETVGVLILQKSKNAKRIYAQVVHAASNCEGYIEGNLLYRTPECQKKFLRQFYAEANVLPTQVEYVEAFGCGLAKMDRSELEAIDEVFCSKRKGPVYVGSVKSNAGHTESAAGVLAVTKMCLMYHNGKIPGNLHCSQPMQTPGVKEGRIKIVTENTPFKRGYAAVCGYAYSGNNCHVLLKGVHKPKAVVESKTVIPHLVVASGRTQSAVNKILDDVSSHPINDEFIGLLRSVHEEEIPGLVFRGYTIVDTLDGKTRCLNKSSEYFPGIKRPVWFVYSGMGSQWSGMATDLMQFPVFSAALQRCHDALAPKGLNLTKIVTDPQPGMFDNILHSFVGIAAVQIGLTDLLQELGIKPDYVIGHSVGELGCAYADGCFTAEQMILAAYSRGLASIETPFIRGSMAAVGMGYNEIKSKCPPEIEVACHNGPESSTISGPADAMKKFVAELTEAGIFAKEVPCSNIAYHSKHIAEAGPKLLKYLQEVIPSPRTRTQRWVSTSVPQQQWSEPKAQLCSAEYHTNNLLSPVLFEEASRIIPANAITIEIAPHGLLQAILRRSLKKDCTNIPLTKRGHKNNVEFFLNAIGKLYEVGLNPRIANIYPKVKFPVSDGTPLLSHLVEWEHSDDWHTAGYEPMTMVKSGERNFVMSIYDDEHRYMTGHLVNGVNIFPSMAYLVLAWDTLARMVGVSYTSLSLIFEDIYFHGQTVISKDQPLELVVVIQKATGNFEIIHKGANVVNGRMRREKSKNIHFKELVEESVDNSFESVVLNEVDIYKIFKLRGYNYSGQFKTIQSFDTLNNRAKVTWNDNWVTYLESLLQINDLVLHKNLTSCPKMIRRLAVNVKEHNRILQRNQEMDNPYLDVVVHQQYGVIQSAGVELESLSVIEVPAKDKSVDKVLEKYDFVPHFNNNCFSEVEELMTSAIHLALQNKVTSGCYQVVELLNQNSTEKRPSLSTLIRDVLRKSPGTDFELTVASDNANNVDERIPSLENISSVQLFVGSNLLNRKTLLNQIYSLLSRDGFVITSENISPTSAACLNKFNIISTTHLGHPYVVLNKKAEDTNVRYMRVKFDESFAWIEKVTQARSQCDRLVLVSEHDPMVGIIGYVNSLRQNGDGARVQAISIEDFSAPAFDPELQLYKEQIAKNIVINVYKEGKWGSYIHLPIREPTVLVPYAGLKAKDLGDLNSIHWVEENVHTLGDNTINVYYSAINYMDVQKATHRLYYGSFDEINKTNTFGMEYCGRNASGVRVMGLVPNGGLSTMVTPVTNLTWEVPANWTMEEAITVPQAYANAFYCLFLRNPLENKAGRVVLVHSGAGALGLAVIRICLANDWKVFTTVGCKEKKDFLLKTFPHLNENQIGYSRDASFEDLIRTQTNGNGCTVVINTLSGPLREASARCVAQFGHLIDLNRGDSFENSPFGMYSLADHRDYLFASFANIFIKEEESLRQKLDEMMRRGIAEGYVRPLPRTIFTREEVPDAFRYLAASRHIGKVVVKMRPEEKLSQVESKARNIEAVPNCFLPDNKSFIIVSGDTGFGLEVAGWLVERGARKIVLHFNKQEITNYLRYKLSNWRRIGLEIRLSHEDITSDLGCKELIADGIRLAPVYGVIYIPYKDGTIFAGGSEVNQCARMFRDVVVPLARLDGLTKRLCPQLSEFVVVTSQTWSRDSGVKTPSHGIAFSALHSLMMARRRHGLPARAVLFGGIEPDIVENNVWWGSQESKTNPQSVQEVLSTFASMLKSSQPVVSCHLPLDNKTKGINVVKVFEEVLGKKLLKEADVERSFEDLGLDFYTAKQISSTLGRNYNLLFTPAFIQRLNINKLEQLQKELELAAEDQPKSGLSALYPSLEAEEYNATEPVMRMPTLLSEGNETEDQFSYEDTYVWMVPGVHGHRSIFSSVCQRLKTKACALQYGTDTPDETVSEIAKRFYKIVKSRQRDTSFKLFAYSFGVSVALELAQLLEKDGYEGKIFCLDGGPEYFKQILDAYFGNWSEAKLQNEVIKHVWKLLGGSEDANLDDILTETTDWDRKVEKAVRMMDPSMIYSRENKKSVLMTFYKRLIQARKCVVSNVHPLKSQIVLIKAKTGIESDDCGLRQYADKPLRVYQIDSDHGKAPFDLQCSAIVNRELGIDEVFTKINNCKIYSLYTNSFN